MKRTLLVVGLSLLGGYALAQYAFTTPNGSNVLGSVSLCDNGSAQFVPCTTANPFPVALPASSNTPYPTGATPLTASSTGTTAGVTATLAGAAAKTTYICGFTITSGATLGLGTTASVTGGISGTLNYVQPVSALPGVAQLPQAFHPCIPASAVNTGISVVSGAAGLGGSTAVAAWGYQL